MTARTITLVVTALWPLVTASVAADEVLLAPHREVFAQALADFAEAQEIQKDQPDRARRLFRQAAQRFQGIVSGGVVSGRLEYNLANSHLQAGDLGRAILHYRRAEQLIPQNQMLVENLKVARQRCLTTIQRTRRSTLMRSLFFWHFQTSESGRMMTAVGAYLLFWLLLTIRTIVSARFLALLAIAAAIVAAASTISVASSRWSDRHAPEGVVTSMDVVVYKGPGTGWQRKFEQPLQPGVEFVLQENTHRGWWELTLADGKSGWIEARDAELISRRD